MFSYSQCISLLPYLPYELLIDNNKLCENQDEINNKQKLVTHLIRKYNVNRNKRKNEKFIEFQSELNKIIHLYLNKYKHYEWSYFVDNQQTYYFEHKLHIFIKEKQKLLWLFNQKFIDKCLLIKLTYELISHLDIKPINNDNICDLNILLFNYQYYNSLIKYKTMKNQLNKDEYKSLYELKDKSILSVIEILKKDEIQAYYINVDSKHLYFSLYEIYLVQHNVILHSINEDIKKILWDKGCFQLDILTSKVDEYVNSTY